MFPDIVRRTSIFRTAKLPFFKNRIQFLHLWKKKTKKTIRCLRKEGYFYIHKNYDR